jgi:hypothetical protein
MNWGGLLARYYEHGHESSGSVKCEHFINQLSDYQRMKNGRAGAVKYRCLKNSSIPFECAFSYSHSSKFPCIKIPLNCPVSLNSNIVSVSRSILQPPKYLIP